MMALRRPLPQNAAMTMASTIIGKERKMSQTRMMMSSTIPLMPAATTPTMQPIVTDKKTVMMLATSEMRAP